MEEIVHFSIRPSYCRKGTTVGLFILFIYANHPRDQLHSRSTDPELLSLHIFFLSSIWRPGSHNFVPLIAREADI